MKIILHFLSLLALFTSSCLAQEAWLLEMDARYANALLAKCRAGNLADYQSALSQLPKLIQGSKIKEIERISSTDRDKGGTHFPQKRIPGKIGEKEVLFHTGSAYSVPKGVGASRWLKIRQGEKIPQSNFEVTTQCPLGKEWAPTFIANCEGVCRVLLERNLESPVDLPTWPAMMIVSADLMAPTSFTWPISDEHMKALQAGPDPNAASKSQPSFYFVDSVEHYNKRTNDMRYGGTTLRWKTMKNEQSELRIEHVDFHPSGKRVVDVFTGVLSFPMKGNPEAIPINLKTEMGLNRSKRR
jgi:hypothetical protein